MTVEAGATPAPDQNPVAPDTPATPPTDQTQAAGAAAQEQGAGDKPDEAYQFDKPGTPSPAPAGDAVGDWREALPEAWRETFKDAKTAEEALDAYKRGVGYNPPKTLNELTLKLPEGVQIDEGVHTNFREKCVALGITKEQAQSLMDWEFQTSKEMRQGIIADGTKQLKEAWGSQFEAKRSMAMRAVTALDRRMDGRFANALAARGLADDAVVIQAFAHIGEMISEDTLSGGNGGGGVGKPESPEDTYKAMNFKR
jgi:hypothetical protein